MILQYSKYKTIFIIYHNIDFLHSPTSRGVMVLVFVFALCHHGAFTTVWCLFTINGKKASFVHVWRFVTFSTLYQTVTPILRYILNRDMCVLLHHYYSHVNSVISINDMGDNIEKLNQRCDTHASCRSTEEKDMGSLKTHYNQYLKSRK